MRRASDADLLCDSSRWPLRVLSYKSGKLPLFKKRCETLILCWKKEREPERRGAELQILMGNAADLTNLSTSSGTVFFFNRQVCFAILHGCRRRCSIHPPMRARSALGARGGGTSGATGACT